MSGESKFPTAEVEYVSFDGTTRAHTRCLQPDRYGFWDKYPSDRPTIPRGAGLSYVAASFSPNSVTIDHSRFNRILAYDEAENTLEVEAGTPLGEIYDFLTPRGRFLAVQPGYPTITVGGCAGADVHGKNQSRDGNFISQVKSARLFHPRHGIIDLSETENPDLFRLTCGGYGLTGNLLSLKLFTKPIQAPVVKMCLTPIPDIHLLRKN